MICALGNSENYNCFTSVAFNEAMLMYTSVFVEKKVRNVVDFSNREDFA